MRRLNSRMLDWAVHVISLPGLPESVCTWSGASEQLPMHARQLNRIRADCIEQTYSSMQDSKHIQACRTAQHTFQNLHLLLFALFNIEHSQGCFLLSCVDLLRELKDLLVDSLNCLTVLIYSS